MVRLNEEVAILNKRISVINNNMHPIIENITKNKPIVIELLKPMKGK